MWSVGVWWRCAATPAQRHAEACSRPLPCQQKDEGRTRIFYSSLTFIIHQLLPAYEPSKPLLRLMFQAIFNTSKSRNS